MFNSALRAIDRISASSGLFGIIVVKGEEGTGKTAFCRRLLEKRALEYDYVQAITSLNSNLQPCNMILTASRALSKAGRFRSTMIVIDSVDDLILEKSSYTSPLEMVSTWKGLTRKSEGKNLVFILTTNLSKNQLTGGLELNSIRDFISLLKFMSNDDMTDFMNAEKVDPDNQKEISRIFSESCSIQKFHDLVRFYKKEPLGKDGKTTWDLEGMEKEFNTNRNYSTDRSAVEQLFS